MNLHIDFSGEDIVARNMAAYAERAHYAVKRVAEYFRPVVEAYAKENAPWVDRTGNARQALHSFVEELAGDIVRLYIAHGVSYGLWLEIRNSGRYAVLWDTLMAHVDAINAMLKEIFS